MYVPVSIRVGFLLRWEWYCEGLYVGTCYHRIIDKIVTSLKLVVFLRVKIKMHCISAPSLSRRVTSQKIFKRSRDLQHTWNVWRALPAVRTCGRLRWCPLSLCDRLLRSTGGPVAHANRLFLCLHCILPCRLLTVTDIQIFFGIFLDIFWRAGTT